jgi:hypothetical protein
MTRSALFIAAMLIGAILVAGCMDDLSSTAYPCVDGTYNYTKTSVIQKSGLYGPWDSQWAFYIVDSDGFMYAYRGSSVGDMNSQLGHKVAFTYAMNGGRREITGIITDYSYNCCQPSSIPSCGCPRANIVQTCGCERK